MAEPATAPAQTLLPDGCDAVSAPVSGNLWQLKVAAGQQVAAGEELLVLEAMKMEISVRAEAAGIVAGVYCSAGRPVNAGDTLLAIRTAVQS